MQKTVSMISLLVFNNTITMSCQVLSYALSQLLIDMIVAAEP